MYTFTEPLSLEGLLLSFLAVLLILVYLVYFFRRRKKILELKKLPTVLIIGLPNTGRTFLLKTLSEGKPTFSDKLLNLDYVDLDHNGKLAARILDHKAFSSSDQLIEKKLIEIVEDIRSIDPLAVIGVIDVSKYSEPLEKQVKFILRMKEFFKDKPFYIVVNKIDETSENKIKKIEKEFGKIYKIRWNSEEDVDILKRDLLECLKNSNSKKK